MGGAMGNSLPPDDIDVQPIGIIDQAEYGFSSKKSPRLSENLNEKIRDLLIDEILRMEGDLSDGYRYYVGGSIHAYLGKKADTIVTIINNYIENS